MSKWIIAIVAPVFALSAASGFAAQTQAGYKKEELSVEQKSEIRDRAARLKTERTQAETAKPATPVKATAPKHTSKVMQHGKTTPQVATAATPLPAVNTMGTPAKR